MNSYSIKTEDTKAFFTFLTTAKSSKKALKQLLKNSRDFKNIVNGENDLVLRIKKL